jgi:hypothetical protein
MARWSRASIAFHPTQSGVPLLHARSAKRRPFFFQRRRACSLAPPGTWFTMLATNQKIEPWRTCVRSAGPRSRSGTPAMTPGLSTMASVATLQCHCRHPCTDRAGEVRDATVRELMKSLVANAERGDGAGRFLIGVRVRASNTVTCLGPARLCSPPERLSSLLSRYWFGG